MREKKKLSSAAKAAKERKTLNRIAFVLFTISFSGLMVLGSTYAWFTSEDSATNEFEGTRLTAEINENFIPNYQWSPGKTTRKEVWVTNTGDTAAFIRVSMDEFLISFEMEIEKTTGEEGTGNVLAIVPKPAKATINRDAPDTWKTNEYYYKQASDEYYRAVSTAPKDLSTTGKGYRVGVPADQAARAASDLAYTNLEYGEVLASFTPSSSDYWLYGNDGYFYYSERVEPGKTTTWLLKSTSLSRSVPNRLKDSLYQIDIKMDAQQSVKGTFDDWSHAGATDPIYLMLKDKVSQ